MTTKPNRYFQVFDIPQRGRAKALDAIDEKPRADGMELQRAGCECFKRGHTPCLLVEWHGGPTVSRGGAAERSPDGRMLARRVWSDGTVELQRVDLLTLETYTEPPPTAPSDRPPGPVETPCTTCGEPMTPGGWHEHESPTQKHFRELGGGEQDDSGPSAAEERGWDAREQMQAGTPANAADAAVPDVTHWAPSAGKPDPFPCGAYIPAGGSLNWTRSRDRVDCPGCLAADPVPAVRVPIRTPPTDSQPGLGDGRTLYRILLDEGHKLDNHESDLYAPDTPRLRELLELFPMHKKTARRFVVQPGHPNAGEVWVDVLFAYEPYWTAAGARPKARRQPAWRCNDSRKGRANLGNVNVYVRSMGKMLEVTSAWYDADSANAHMAKTEEAVVAETPDGLILCANKFDKGTQLTGDK